MNNLACDTIYQSIYTQNSFQAILISDGKSSYVIYTYLCGSLEWGVSQEGIYSVIGYNINPESYADTRDDDFTSFANHRFSSLPDVEDIACQNLRRGSLWTNLIYKVGESKDVEQLARVECGRLAKEDDVKQTASDLLLTSCPCTRNQALRDPAYREVDMFDITRDPVYLQYNCYIRRVRFNTYLPICCYR